MIHINKINNYFFFFLAVILLQKDTSSLLFFFLNHDVPTGLIGKTGRMPGSFSLSTSFQKMGWFPSRLQGNKLVGFGREGFNTELIDLNIFDMSQSIVVNIPY